MGKLLLPVGERRMSSWEAHQHRVPRSTEPGTDFYCPIGTPVYAPEDGRVYGWSNSIIPATGRWVGLDLVTGQRFRAMHFSRIALSESTLRNGGFVRKGQLIAYSGASGYGDNDWSWNPNTGGAHTHVTLWPTHETRFGYRPNGKPYTVDFMDYADTSSSAGGGVSPTPIPEPEPIPEKEEEDDMAIENVMHHKINADKRMEVKVSNPFSGFELNFVTGSKDTLQEFADQYKTGNSQLVSASVFRVIGEACAAVRPQGNLAITLGDADE